MLKRLYVDNYKCLVNFEFTFAPLQLLIGRNGTGKTTVSDLLVKLRMFAYGFPTSDSFPPHTRTRWETRTLQTFVLELDGNGGTYQYRLTIEQDRQRRRARVEKETLAYNQGPLFVFDRGEAKFFRDDHSSGPQIPLDGSRSGLSILPPLQDNTRLTWFTNRLQRIHSVRIDPLVSWAGYEEEQPHPSWNMSGFANWYRYLTRVNPRAAVTELFESLTEVLDGFQGLRFTADGRVLEVELGITSELTGAPESQRFSIDELSDGQRVLIALYTLLHNVVEEDSTLFIDEPDNYLALAEIQPWLMAVNTRVEDRNSQLLMISHHPEVIDYLTAANCVQFSRLRHGPIRVRPFTINDVTGLPASELIARGWEDE